VSLAALSLGALFVVIAVSCFSRLNVGLLALAAAWIVGVYFGGLRAEEVAAGFPSQLFLTLAGVTIFFTQAQNNGTLKKAARNAVRLCRGNTGVIPILFFLVAAALASAGPGNIATAALIAPMAMATAGRAGVPAFLMAIMVGNGANSGSLSPIAPTGIIVGGLMERIGLTGMQTQTFFANFAAHAAVAFLGYAAFGGLRLFRATAATVDDASPEPFSRENWITVALIGALIIGVIAFGIQIGFAAFAGAVLLALFRAADSGEAIRKAPWTVVLMVTGVTVLIGLLERTGGLDLFAGLLARLSTANTVTAVVAFVTGLISTYSSTSAVVLPAFLPAAPSLAERLGADPKAIALSMNVGSHLVDVSPLSTIGALCIASAAEGEDTSRLFNRMLAWGLSMTVVGAGLCWVFFR
jgi:Na+/H+ antiporter NhaD/arsenite permease-like protein